LLSGRPKTYNADAMRILVGCLLVATASVVLTQSSQEFVSLLLFYKFASPPR